MAPPCGDAAAELTSLRISEGGGLPPLPGRYRPFFHSLSDSLTNALYQPSTEGFGGFSGLFAQAKRRRQCGRERGGGRCEQEGEEGEGRYAADRRVGAPRVQQDR